MRLSGYGCCFIENDIWFVDIKFPYLFKYVRETGECELVCKLPVDHANIVPYSDVVLCDDKVVCTPGSSNHIAIFDLKNNNLTDIPILPLISEHNVQKHGETGAVDFAVRYNDNVIMFGNCCECIFDLNVPTGSVEVKNSLYKELRGNKSDTACLFRKDIATRDENIYLALFNENRVVEYSLETHLYRILEIERKSPGYIGICYDGVYFWLLEKGGKLLKWELQSNRIHRIIDIPDFGNEAGGRFFHRNGKLYILKQGIEEYYLYDPVKGNIEKKKFKESKSDRLQWARYPFVYEFKDNLYISNMGRETIEIYDGEWNLKDEIEFEIRSAYIDEMWKDFMIESGEAALKDFLLCLESRRSKPAETSMCGAEIYRELRR